MSKESSSQDEMPIPPRFMWLKRGAIGFGLLLVTLAVLRFWWGHEAQRRMERLAQVAHARGEPFYPRDFRQVPIPDAQNAAVPIEAAIKKLRDDLTHGLPNPANGDVGPPLPGELPELDAMIRHFQIEMHLVRLARARPKTVYAEPPDGPPYRLNSYRMMAQILIMAANYEYAVGDDGRAAEFANDAILLADTLDRGSQSFAADVTATGIDEETTGLLERIAWSLSISDHSGQEASHDQIRSLIAALLEEQAMGAGAIRGSEGDGASAINFVPDSGLMGNEIAIKVFEPMYKLDGARIHEFESANARSYDQATFPAAISKLRRLPTGERSALETLARPIEALLNFSPAVPVRFHFQTLTERRVSAIMLALRLYKFDHHEKLPVSLSDLVPTYLPAVPRDPFDPANGSIRYLPMHDPPLLYSVGFNETDEGGSEKYLPLSEPMTQRWHNEDVVYPLQALPRISPAQDHQGNK